MTNKCPICHEGRPQRRGGWTCGTFEVWQDDDGKPLAEPIYSTGTQCDLTVFRNGFVRCADLLRESLPHLPEELRRRVERELEI